MEKKVVVIHTSPVTLDVLKALFKEIIPNVRMINIIDDGILQDLITYGGTTPSIIRRVCQYAIEAEALGADAIFNQCSSVGEAVDIARTMIHVPFVKIDEAMAEVAIRTGSRISIIGTSASTIGPSTRLVERAAGRLGIKVEVKGYLVDDAFDALTKEGDIGKHNKLVVAEIERIQDLSDVIILAQGSMVALLSDLTKVKKPVFSSPRLGVEQLKLVLEL